MSLDRPRIPSLRALALSLLLVAGITFTCSQLPVNASTVGFAFLLLILAIATVWGLVEAAIASVVAMLSYNFYFLPPVGRFTIADPENWVALFTFLVTALVASHLSDRAKRQTIEAKRRQRETEQLYALSRAILLTETSQPVGAQAAQHIAQIFEIPAVILYDAKSGASFRGGAVDIVDLEAVLKQVVLEGSLHHDPQSSIDVWPITLGGSPIGALAAKGLRLSDGAAQALINLVAIALERVRTEETAKQAEIARRSEEFKSTLLDAIAHEFKTPLTSIKAASSSLLTEGSQLRADHLDLASIIDEEADRLNLLVTEAVRMSQVEAGSVKLERSLIAVDAVFRSAVVTFGSRAKDRVQSVPISAETPPVLVDAELMVLAIRQLIDNGLKYSPPGSPVTLEGALDSESARVILRVTDRGPGIGERDRDRIFDKFYRHDRIREKIPGSGLGLHIAREIARTHGGDLWVESAAHGGSSFCLALPLSAVRPHNDSEIP